MTAAYIDSSVVIATAFNEAGISKLTDSIYNCDSFVSSNLLEAEVRSVFSRQRVPIPESLLHGIAWTSPERTLTQTAADDGVYFYFSLRFPQPDLQTCMTSVMPILCLRNKLANVVCND